MRILFLFLCGIPLTWCCPQKCRCTQDNVDCSGAGLIHIPTGISSQTRVLNLRRNHIDSVKIADLQDFPQLEILILTGNRIRNIQKNILDVLPSLRRLVLSRNRLVTIPTLTSTTHEIRSLDISYNNIQRIEQNMLNEMTHLTNLDLSRNLIRFLPDGVFSQNRLLTTVHLAHNPWHCDCRLKWVVETQFMNNTPCAFPKALRGINIKDHVSNFDCQLPTVESREFNVHLSCLKQQHSNVVWIYHDVELSSLSIDWAFIAENQSLIVPLNQAVEDFKCTHDFLVHSRLRSSRQTNKKTGRAPHFKFAPRDSAYREGTAVTLHCEIEGEPKPTISWYHKRQVIINSKKHELSAANQMLKIYPFIEDDVGSYTCMGTNVHGRAQHSARIQLLSSVQPTIFDAPTNIVAQLGQQTTFRCRSRGVPQPEITWFFEGNVIKRDSLRFTLSNDGTELTVPRASRPYEGSYSCTASNSIGSATAEANLTVNADIFRRIDAVVDEKVLQSVTDAARDKVNKAYAAGEALKKQPVKNPEELRKLFRFAIPAASLEASKAREIYEESIRLIYEHVQRGLHFSANELAPNVSYEAVLQVSHIQTLMEMSGCQTGQVLKDFCTNTCFNSKYRTYDGQCNNIEHPMWGASSMPLLRLLPPIYENGFNTPVGWEKGKLYNGYPMPNARDVSRSVISTKEITPHSHLSAFVMQWGQWTDHDLTHTAIALARQSYASGALCNKTCENVDPCFNIQLSPDDPKLHTGVIQKHPCMEFERNGAVCGSGETSVIFQRVTYRDQMNILTSYLDASQVYGSSEAQALEVRDLYGDHGLLRFDIVSNMQKPYLPFEKDSEMDCRRNFSRENPIPCFLAGDLRANDQLALTSLHTVFLREHNRVAAQLLEMNINWDGETIFQETRKIIGAMVQHITYTEWLPAVLGKTGYAELIGPYQGYNPETHPNIANAFATAAFRFGHTLINPVLYRFDKNMQPIKDGHIPLHKAFFAPERLLSEGGIDPLLRGLYMAPLKMPRSDQVVNAELTEKLFNRYHEVALDLTAINIQRGRDHALPHYSEYRRWCNLTVAETWDDLAKDVPDPDVRAKLQKLYGHPGNIDLWVGGVIEKRLPDALMGPTFACIIAEQFRRTREADRFWYENPGVFTPSQRQQIKKTSIARLLCDNADDIDTVPRNVFMYHGNSTKFFERCERIPAMKLNQWMECCESTCAGVAYGANEARKRRWVHRN